ncbi:GNAT family N-acetyltransferase [Couchioplanes azureus]|uniref:GNAT family N-acetyltransferase n=1 Tax=Couchioplanes caeruleus TaxID=56438 RepID=UPI0016715DC6|nr:GNAT family N-acetyltransferase [Couchioplanes caeruleus]GGQ45944.1 GCN5 family N-acetyltransferase [Couchioplanes caeruleus subsp. azureus]
MRVDDLETVRGIESRAGALFHDVGMSDIAAHPAPSADVLARFVHAGRGWVVAGDADVPVAYVLVELVDGLAHIEQVSVDPPYARKGLGRDLIDHVARWAAADGLPALTLTTFRAVPWNGPYYSRLGFVEVAAQERGPELARLMAREAEHGLDPVERISMCRPV